MQLPTISRYASRSAMVGGGSSPGGIRYFSRAVLRDTHRSELRMRDDAVQICDFRKASVCSSLGPVAGPGATTPKEPSA
jgi:hypothetical protein